MSRAWVSGRLRDGTVVILYGWGRDGNKREVCRGLCRGTGPKVGHFLRLQQYKGCH